MKTVMQRCLKSSPKEIHVYGSSGVSHKVIPIFMEKWHNARTKKQIPLKIIFNYGETSETRIKKGPKIGLGEYRFSPIPDISITGTMIYNHTVVLMLWHIETPLAISIQNKEISKSYENNFKLLWKQAKK